MVEGADGSGVLNELIGCLSEIVGSQEQCLGRQGLRYSVEETND